jgi:hypothetical protein
MPELSLRAYAKHRGVSLKAVQKAIQSGRIRTTSDGKVDVEQADGDWQRNTGPRPRAGIASSSPPPRRVPMAAPDPPRQEMTAAGPLDYARARAVHENYKARLAKMEFDKRSGKLVNSDEVQVATFNLLRMLRDRALNIPDRVSATLAAESDPAKVHAILTTEIRKALLDFAHAANG